MAEEAIPQRPLHLCAQTLTGRIFSHCMRILWYEGSFSLFKKSIHPLKLPYLPSGLVSRHRWVYTREASHQTLSVIPTHPCPSTTISSDHLKKNSPRFQDFHPLSSRTTVRLLRSYRQLLPLFTLRCSRSNINLLSTLSWLPPLINSLSSLGLSQ